MHDSGPYRDDRGQVRLRPGMVLTIEPGLYFGPQAKQAPDIYRGIGIRIEDDVLVTEDGCRVLSQAIPKDPDELESIVAGLPLRTVVARDRIFARVGFSDPVVMKLPKDEPLPAAPAAAAAASVIVPPAAIEPSETIAVPYHGGFVPRYFLPVLQSGIAEPPLHSVNGGEEPPAPVALCRSARIAAPNHFQRNRTISLIFCRFKPRGLASSVDLDLGENIRRDAY